MSKEIISRFDVVGSYLRTPQLKAARSAFDAKEISVQQLQAVEDTEIKALVDKQIKAGLAYVTDGEFRRSYWHLDFFWGFAGVERRLLPSGYQFVGLETRGDTASICGKISGENHPFIEHFKFVFDYVGDQALVKQTIPAPAQFLGELLRPENTVGKQQYYPNAQDLHDDLVAAYETVIHDLYQAGCRHLQLDDCSWGMFLDEESLKKINIPAAVVDDILESYLAINNDVIATAPKDMVISTHVCRGNYHSHHAFSGGYDRVAPVLFGKENVDNFYLEFDDERSGGFECLQHVSGNKRVVLGLITSKTGTLEDKSVIINRIKEASQYLPLDRLLLSPQCGFASTEEGNILTEEQQWAKIALIKEIAEQVWK